ASLAAALRVIAAAAHVRTLTIPVLGSGKQQSASGGLLSRFRRGRAESPEPDGCDPAVFAEQITAYLKEAAAERAEREDYPASRAAGITDRPHQVYDTREIVPTAQAFEAPEPAAFESYTGADTFAADTFASETFATDTFAAETFAAETFAAETPAPRHSRRRPTARRSQATRWRRTSTPNRRCWTCPPNWVPSRLPRTIRTC